MVAMTASLLTQSKRASFSRGGGGHDRDHDGGGHDRDYGRGHGDNAPHSAHGRRDEPRRGPRHPPSRPDHGDGSSSTRLEPRQDWKRCAETRRGANNERYYSFV